MVEHGSFVFSVAYSAASYSFLEILWGLSSLLWYLLDLSHIIGYFVKNRQL